MVQMLKTGAVTSGAGCHLCPPFSGSFGHGSRPQLEISHTWTELCLYFHFIWLNHFWGKTQLFIRRTVMKPSAYISSYILAKKEEMNHVVPICIFHVMSLMSLIFVEHKSLL